MTLRAARILSSETDNTIKQEQETNVNINIKPQTNQHVHPERRPSTVPLYPNVEPLNNNSERIFAPQNVNFTIPNPQMSSQEAGQTINSQMTQGSPLAFQPQTNSPFQSNMVQDKGIADLGNELDELGKQNQFLKMIIEAYESNPLKVNSYLVCESKLLMDMIKILTGCEKVELVLDEDVGCGGCGASSGKIIYVSKILVTKGGKTEDLKYAYNVIYSQFIKYGISLKMVC